MLFEESNCTPTLGKGGQSFKGQAGQIGLGFGHGLGGQGGKHGLGSGQGGMQGGGLTSGHGGGGHLGGGGGHGLGHGGHGLGAGGGHGAGHSGAFGTGLGSLQMSGIGGGSGHLGSGQRPPHCQTNHSSNFAFCIREQNVFFFLRKPS